MVAIKGIVGHHLRCATKKTFVLTVEDMGLERRSFNGLSFHFLRETQHGLAMSRISIRRSVPSARFLTRECSAPQPTWLRKPQSSLSCHSGIKKEYDLSFTHY